jgi:hypothetical protein
MENRDDHGLFTKQFTEICIPDTKVTGRGEFFKTRSFKITADLTSSTERYSKERSRN